jgi:hypothetical protein
MTTFRRRAAPCYRSANSRREGAMQIRFGAIVIAALVMPQAPQAQTFPGADWQRKTPAEAGINPQLLKDAIDFSIASEIKNPRDLKLNHYRTFGREPFGDAIGPIKDRGDLTGVIIHKGVLVAEWTNSSRPMVLRTTEYSGLRSLIPSRVYQQRPPPPTPPHKNSGLPEFAI